jgi:Uma2 family endonuclease
MRTLLPDPPPAEIETVLEHRRAAGADKLDEVWDGVVHVSPDPSLPHGDVANQLAVLLSPLARAAGLRPHVSPFNLGEPGSNFRIPDGGLLRARTARAFVSTAALVIEIVSPGDDSWKKFDYFAAHDVDEVLIVDPLKRTVHWLALVEGEYVQVERSALIDLGRTKLAERIDWPPIEG